jgi:hypothetical protein
VDRVSKHEFADKEFFTPTKRAGTTENRSQQNQSQTEHSDSESSEEEVDENYAGNANNRTSSQGEKQSPPTEHLIDEWGEEQPDWKVDADLRRRSKLGL